MYQERPLGVNIISAIFVINSGISGFILLFTPLVTNQVRLADALGYSDVIGMVIDIVEMIVMLVIACGYFNLKRWGFWAMIFYLVFGLLLYVTLFILLSYISVVVLILPVWMLIYTLKNTYVFYK